MEKIIIGKIVNAVGLKGEVKVYNYSDGVDIYTDTEAIYVEDRLLKVQNVRTQKNMVILKLDGIDNRDEAERAKGSMVYVTEEDLPQLPEGEYYVRDLMGMDVILENGSRLGELKDVIQNTAQDVFEIETEDGRQVLIPKVPEFVINIDADSRTITVRVIEGMI